MTAPRRRLALKARTDAGCHAQERRLGILGRPERQDLVRTRPPRAAGVSVPKVIRTGGVKPSSAGTSRQCWGQLGRRARQSSVDCGSVSVPPPCWIAVRTSSMTARRRSSSRSLMPELVISRPAYSSAE